MFLSSGFSLASLEIFSFSAIADSKSFVRFSNFVKSSDSQFLGVNFAAFFSTSGIESPLLSIFHVLNALLILFIACTS
jgi:hypothetical protein